MTERQKQAPPTFGFLTVVEHPAAGLVGGYLLVNHRGRPIEFHCTAPVQPTRAEEILFGPTLRPHLFCERIGAALLSKAKTVPQFVVVNQLECWQLADETTLPVVLVDPKHTAPAKVAGEGYSSERAPTAQACLDQVAPDSQEHVGELLQQLVRYVDLTEPFERITEAIREAMGFSETRGEIDAQSSAPSTDEGTHDQAA